MKKITAIMFTFVVIFAACQMNGNRVKGNGHVTTQSRPIGDITGVEQHSSFDVVLLEGSPSNVKIEAEENIIPYIVLHVENGVLNIETENHVSLRTNKGVKIYVTAPTFNKVQNTGSGDVTSETRLSNDTQLRLSVSGSGDMKLDVDAPEVIANVSGSGGLKLSGEAQLFNGKVTGSGDIRAMDLMTEESTVSVSGSGGIDVYSSVKVNAQVSGSGDIRYKGGANVVSSSKSGSGDIKRVD
jgi:hypothetical protein